MSFRMLIACLLCLLTCLCGKAVGFESRALSLDDIPPCGLQCLFLSIPATNCAFNDYDCQCHDNDLAHTLSSCMLANCTMADALGTAKVQADICHFSDESTTREVTIYTVTVFTIGAISVALRITGKLVAKRVSSDDWIIIAAILLASIPCGCVLAMTQLGFGEHLWNLQPRHLLRVLRLFYIAESAYVIVLGLIKVSLVMFYLQIFDQSRKFRITAYGVFIYIVINTSIIFFLTLFSCKPVESFWDRDVKGNCMDINALAYANSASAIVQDIILLILPLAMVRNLNMKRYRKIAVGLMFSIGTFGCITTIFRLHALLKFEISIDPTWDYVPATIWTDLELCCGFVCISLPSIRILVAMILPKNLFASITSRSSRNGNTPRPGIGPGHNGCEEMKGSSRTHEATWYSESSTPRSHSQGSLLSSSNRSLTRHKRRPTIGSMFTNQEPISRIDPGRTVPAAVTQSNSTLAVPEDARRTGPRGFCPSCGSDGDFITALPNIGLLPDRSYSVMDLTRLGRQDGDDRV
ncbi:hypothetical protein BDV96DRAFT_609196 [Lophiotrema nucula]|uniref:CFEM domain-containing protein n=1 Tax=Lophiotrema nucula TaxID=690887 RepID=A0A6A5ZT38_9PLEO|nr:hypothetical protein BDV96DRAFT_609196 [Lophiotrema nucula]